MSKLESQINPQAEPYQRNFENNQRSFEAAAEASRGARAGSGELTRPPQRRRSAEQKAGANGGEKGEQEHSTVDGSGLEAR